MKFRNSNPFLSAILKASRSATRSATRKATGIMQKNAGVMQKSAIKATVAALQRSFKQPWPGAVPAAAPTSTPIPPTRRRAANGRTKALPGEFVARSLTNAAGMRKYKLYVPDTYAGQPMPLLVMLHGCSQDPDDFAAGTRMNRIAGEAGCFVVYPAQSKSANGHKCWNWFSAIDQQRDRGEASIIADITRAVIATYGCDRRRVFVAGLSAGGAMAVIMGNRYPELYAAVGVHSGVPYAAARDLHSAMAVMRRGAAAIEADRIHRADADSKPLPVIVFHGDGDKTVHPRNGEQIIEQALAHFADAERTEHTERKEQGGAAHYGKGETIPLYTRAIYEDATQRPMAELWTLHGMAHAWSGGSSAGSYTAAGGPDASAEMMRFFTTAAQ